MMCERSTGLTPALWRKTFLAFGMGAGFPLMAQQPASAVNSREPVPFVGCKSDGQHGPMEAPRGEAPVLPIGAAAAQRLSYYQAQGSGVLAPRGWYCFGTYGSGGDALYVSPEAIDSATIFSGDWKGFSGPAIAITHQVGGTSGRFGVANVIARVFPAHTAFVNEVKKGEPTSSFARGPYARDRLTYKSKEMVEYVTPGQTDGLGTISYLQKNAFPISGVAILVGQTPDLLLLSVRLPANLTDLTSAILQQVEREAALSQ